MSHANSHWTQFSVLYFSVVSCHSNSILTRSFPPLRLLCLLPCLLACLLSSMSQLCSSLSETDRAIFSLQQCIFWPPSTHFSFSLFDVTVCRCYRLCVCANQNDRWASPLSLSPFDEVLYLQLYLISHAFPTNFCLLLSLSLSQVRDSLCCFFVFLDSAVHSSSSSSIFPSSSFTTSFYSRARCGVHCCCCCWSSRVSTLLSVCLCHSAWPSLFSTLSHTDTQTEWSKEWLHQALVTLSRVLLLLCVIVISWPLLSIDLLLYLSNGGTRQHTNVGLLSVCVCVLTTEWVSGSPFAAHYLSSFLSSELNWVCSSVSAYTELS